MTEAKARARIREMATLSINWDGCGSSPPTSRQTRAATQLLDLLVANGLAVAISAITVCPSGEPLFDFVGVNRASIVVAYPLDWVIILRDYRAAIQPLAKTDTAGVVAMLGKFLKGELALPDS